MNHILNNISHGIDKDRCLELMKLVGRTAVIYMQDINDNGEKRERYRSGKIIGINILILEKSTKINIELTKQKIDLGITYTKQGREIWGDVYSRKKEHSGSFNVNTKHENESWKITIH